jgi:hypothetical protein
MHEHENENETYVQQSGLAVVHHGEKIVAAEGSQAVLATRSGAQVHYHFPIHVVMVGDLGEETKCEIEARIWDKLNSALT